MVFVATPDRSPNSPICTAQSLRNTLDLPAHRKVHHVDMEIILMSIADCPTADLARQRINDALRQLQIRVTINELVITSLEQAAESGFSGSPTILIDGRDPFAPTSPGPVALACRLYRTPDRTEGAPSHESLVTVLRQPSVAPQRRST